MMALPRTSLRLVLVAVFALTASALTLPAQPAAAQPAGTQTAELQSPAAFLGYELGEAFTPHHRMVDYVRHVAAASERVQVQQYGTSYEGRPLLLATIGTEENLGRIDEIRQNNLRRTGMLDGEAPADSPAIVWLSYNVHGNESVSTEAALQVLYDFAHPQNERTSGYLQNSVVLLDPCLNPDGRERYVQWYKRTAGAEPNANPAAREHHEPWPGGRTNHYYFDLNRDWAWGVQKETRHRLEVYNRWMPHVHVDFHEMGVDEPYYFAPAARPFHENITDWQREFQFTVGRTNAKYFDQNGWLYFTRQVFDLFYPGYGDTWPIFNGAIGMTYEQGGSGRAGLAVETAEGDTLTLADRIAHHHSTSLSTVEVAATNRQEVVREFGGYYREARQNPPGEYETYVVKRDADGGERLRAFARHLDRQRIRYGVATESASARGRSYRSGETAGVTVEAGDLVVQARQPKARLVKVLMEPQTTIVDSLTYDITAWGLPYAYGLDAYALPDRMTVPTQDSVGTSSGVRGGSAAPYAYLARWTSRADVAFASDLLKHGVSLRFTRREITTGGQTYAPGTVIVTRAGNRDVSGFDDLVRETAQRHEQVLHAVESGFVSEGPDFGSSDLGFVEDPHVAVLAGPPTSSNSLGEVWHFFDRQIDYPLTLLPAEDFDASVLEDVNVLVVPEGRYGEWMTTERTEALAGWVREGGRLVAIGSANGALAGKKPFGLATKSADKKENGDEDGDGGETYGEESGETSADDPLRRYGDRERDRLPEATPGSIHRTRVDTTHPLGFGVSDPYFTLKRSDDAYAYLKDGWNVVALETAEPVSGFMGHEAQDAVGETLVYGAESLGRGRVVYLVDNPLFRGFWYGGQMVFANAVFVVGN